MVNWGENVRKSSIQIKEYIFILLYKIKKIGIFFISGIYVVGVCILIDGNKIFFE